MKTIEQKANIMRDTRFTGVHVVLEDFLKEKIGEPKMKFDCVIMNPPYHAGQETGEGNESGRRGKNDSLWDKFVVKSLELLKPNGFLVAVHPSRWRKPTDSLWEIMRQKQIEYLEIHNEKDGIATFGCNTRYDWYVMSNCQVSHPTFVKDQNGMETKVDLKTASFLPNSLVDKVVSLLAKAGEKRVEILRTCAYHTQKLDLMKEKADKKNKYPCVWSIAKNGDAKYYWSNTSKLGHFGVPKVIFASGSISSANFVLDLNGEFGLTQYAKAIVDTKENLKKIYKAMQSENFKRVMEACAISFHEIDKDILSLFRKDFWKEFV